MEIKVFASPISYKSKYLSLLQSGGVGHFRFETGPASLIETATRQARSSLLHLHWEEFLFKGCESRAEADEALRRFERLISNYYAAGGKLLLTIHNRFPHVMPFLEHFHAARAIALQTADAVIVHNTSSADEVIATHSCDSARIHQIDHPSSVGVYESEEQAVSRIDGFHDGELLIFGQIRRQKGIREAVAALPAHFLEACALYLAILGRGEHADELQRECQDRADVRWEIGYVPDLAAISRIGRATCCLLPYQQFLTSGVAHLVLSAGGIYVAPRVAQHLALLPTRNHQFLYEKGDDADFRRAVVQAAALSPAERLECRLANYRRALSLAPHLVAPKLALLYQSLLRH